jgi:hypothetical protein
MLAIRQTVNVGSGSKRAAKTCPLRRQLSPKAAIAVPSTWRGRKPVAAVALIVSGAAAASTSRTFCLDHVGARPVFPGASTHDISNRSVVQRYRENGEDVGRFANASLSADPENRPTCLGSLSIALESSGPSHGQRWRHNCGRQFAHGDSRAQRRPHLCPLDPEWARGQHLAELYVHAPQRQCHPSRRFSLADYQARLPVDLGQRRQRASSASPPTAAAAAASMASVALFFEPGLR